MDSASVCCAGGLPIESRHPTSAAYVACRECDWLPCWLSKRSAGVAPEVNLRNPLCAGEEVCKQGNPPYLWNTGQTSPEVQNRGISGPTKRTYVLQIFLKNELAKCYSSGIWTQGLWLSCPACHCLSQIPLFGGTLSPLYPYIVDALLSFGIRFFWRPALYLYIFYPRTCTLTQNALVGICGTVYDLRTE